MSDIAQQIAALSPEKLQSLADRLLTRRAPAADEERVPARPRPASIPLSYSQEGLWLLDRLGTGATYNETMALRIEGALDVAVLERALSEIVARHETLRTRIVTSAAGVGEQVIEPPRTLRLDAVDLSAFRGDDRDAAVLQHIDALRAPFKLAEETLIRVVLLRLSGNEHVLGLAVHHIVWDMASFAIFMRELHILYASLEAGRPSPLPPLEAQYADHAIWQRERLQGAAFERQLDYWKRHLAGAPPALELPTDRPRGTHPTFEGAHIWFAISNETMTAVKELARGESATLNMIMLAAFQLLLSRWSGQKDLVVGAPVAGRARKPTEQMIGYFVNLQGIRADLSGAPTFRQFLGRVRQSVLDAIANQDVPFDRVVAELQTERDSARHSLFQVAFALQAHAVKPAGAAGAAALSISPMKLRSETSKFDLHMELFEQADGLTGKIEYASDLFDESTAERFARNFGTLLTSIIADPDRAVDRLPILTDSERRQLVETWNDTSTAYPSDRAIHELFDEQAARAPEAIAVVCGSEQLTYGELAARSNRLAHDLVRQGVGPDALVGLFVERSLDAIAAMLAILKAGGAYLPLDPSYPDERLRYIVDDARMPVVLTQQHLLPRWTSLGASVPVQCLDASAPLPASGERVREAGVRGATRPDIAPHPAFGHPLPASGARGSRGQNLAYVIYTSGSTGGPKGVAVTHAAVNRLVRDTNYIELDAGANVAQVANTSFDAATFEIWGALLNGGRITIIAKSDALAPAEFARQLRDGGVTSLFLTTALFNQYVRQSPGIFASLKHLLFGGEACDPAAVREALRSGKPEHLLHVYGPTESTTFASFHPVTQVSERATTVPIGKPLANTTIHVVDELLEPVPVGVIGELCIGGDGLARGYLGRPALTAEKFVPNPFEEGRLYRTGDLVRRLPDGAIEFVGRIDDQVKIRGFRIELGEIEAVLLAHPSVRECAVIAREDGGRKQLVAYVVGAGVDHAALRGHVLQSLPDYMVPAAFVTLERLPLNANGKLDRQALPGPDFRESADAYVAPRTPAEETLAKIMREVLNLERVSIADNFFDIGGDSIIAIQVVAQAKEAGLKVSLKDLFQLQSVEKIAAVAAGGRAQRAAAPKTVEGVVPFTPIQRKVMNLLGDDFARNVPVMVWQCAERMAAPALDKALRALVRHHDALRLGIRKSGEQFNAAPSVVDAAPLLVEVDGGDLQEIAKDLAESIDLATPPIVRAALVDVGAEQRLLLAIHHLAFDPVSLPIVLEDLQNAYAAARDGREIAFPPKTTSYKAWAEQIAAHTASPAMAGEAEFWRGRPWNRCKALPRDHENGGAPSPQIAAVALSESDTEALTKSAQRQYGVPVDTLLAASLADALAAWTGSRTVLFDVMHHGRVDLFKGVDVSRTVGWFSTEIPLVVDLGEDPVAAVDRALQSMPNHGIGYGILRHLNGDEILAAAPSPEVRLNHLGRMAGGGGSSDALFRARFDELAAQAASKLDRLIEVRTLLHGGRLQAQWLYDAAVHDAATIRAVAENFIQNVRALAAAALAVR